jgi:glyoxylase-like metal-dependent hydrolase (beta-lactamase superfamily II)
MTRLCHLGLLVLAGCPHGAPRATVAADPVFVPGAFDIGREPDGNSEILDAPDGLVVVDTGRHPAHVDELLAYAQQRGKPIAAIVNTHWHLDHTGGNAEILAAYPHAEVIATNAIEGALVGFFPASRDGDQQYLASGQATPEQAEDIQLDLDAMDHPEALRPTRPVTATGAMAIAGRTFDVHVAPFAATEADLWLYDPASRTLIAGDLVVAMVPFLDTACASGWRTALGDLDAVPFQTLLPGHGAPMTHDDFTTWRTAFDALLDCAATDRADDVCADAWAHDAAAFYPADQRDRVAGFVDYYLDSNLRNPEAQRFCEPLEAS